MDATENMSLAPNQDLYRSSSQRGAIAYSSHSPEDPYATATTIPDISSPDSRGPASCTGSSSIFSGPQELRFDEDGPGYFIQGDFLNYHGNNERGRPVGTREYVRL